MSVDVRDMDALTAWLGVKPPEVIMAVVARSALRSLLLVEDHWVSFEKENGLILKLLRAISSSWCAAKYPGQIGRIGENANYSISASYVSPDATLIANGIKAVFSFQDHLFHKLVSYGQFGFRVSLSAWEESLSGKVSHEAILAVFNNDINTVFNVSDLIDFRLWSVGLSDGPNLASNQIEEIWNGFKSKLLQIHPNWRVWTDWYEARLYPDKFPAPNKKLELARATIPNEIWDQGWEVVNPHIEGLIEKYAPVDIDPEEIDQVEPQNPSAIIFTAPEGLPIDVDALAGSAEVQTDEDAVDRYEEVKRLVQKFLDDFNPNDRGANQVTGLLEDIQLYSQTFGDGLDSIRPSLLVTRGDSLRKSLEAQDNLDDLSDFPEYSAKHRDLLTQIVNAHNLLVGLDPSLANRDEIRLGPDAVKNLISPQEGQQILHDAVEMGAATSNVESQMAEEAALAPEIPDASNRKSRRYSESMKNFARATLARARSFILQHKGKVTAGSSYAIAKGVVANEAWLLKQFAENQYMLDIITKILSILHKLPLL